MIKPNIIQFFQDSMKKYLSIYEIEKKNAYIIKEKIEEITIKYQSSSNKLRPISVFFEKFRTQLSITLKNADSQFHFYAFGKENLTKLFIEAKQKKNETLGRFIRSFYLFKIKVNQLSLDNDNQTHLSTFFKKIKITELMAVYRKWIDQH